MLIENSEMFIDVIYCTKSKYNNIGARGKSLGNAKHENTIKKVKNRLELSLTNAINLV
jgi:hypothetical protein